MFKNNLEPLVSPVCSLKTFTFGDASCDFKDNKDKDPHKQFSKSSSFLNSANLGKKPLLFPVVKYQYLFFFPPT